MAILHRTNASASSALVLLMLLQASCQSRAFDNSSSGIRSNDSGAEQEQFNEPSTRLHLFNEASVPEILRNAIHDVKSGARTPAQVIADASVLAALDAGYDPKQVSDKKVLPVFADTLKEGENKYEKESVTPFPLKRVIRRGWMPDAKIINFNDTRVGLIQGPKLGKAPKLRYHDCDVKFLHEVVDASGNLNLAHFIPDASEIGTEEFSNVEWLYTIDDESFHIRIARRVRQRNKWKPVHSQLPTCTPSKQRNVSAILVNTLGAGRIRLEPVTKGSRIFRVQLVDNHSGHFKPAYSVQVAQWVATVFQLHGINLGGASGVKFEVFPLEEIESEINTAACENEAEKIPTNQDVDGLRELADYLGSDSSACSTRAR